jgi:hypothetical protein
LLLLRLPLRFCYHQHLRHLSQPLLDQYLNRYSKQNRHRHRQL